MCSQVSRYTKPKRLNRFASHSATNSFSTFIDVLIFSTEKFIYLMSFDYVEVTKVRENYLRRTKITQWHKVESDVNDVTQDITALGLAAIPIMDLHSFYLPETFH